MPLLILILFFFGISVFCGMPIEIDVLIGLYFVIEVFFIRLNGGFRACPLCGSHMTQRRTEEIPDFSHGWRRPHTRVVLECWNSYCRKETVLEGFDCESSPKEDASEG